MATSILEEYFPEYNFFLLQQEILILAIEYLCELREMMHDNGQLCYQYSFVNGKDHGKWQGWYENGQLEYQYSFVNGKQHGTWKGWYKNGQNEHQYKFKNGESHGEWKTWHKNGVLENKCSYLDGKKSGLSIWRDNNNKIIFVHFYENGIKIKSCKI